MNAIANKQVKRFQVGRQIVATPNALESLRANKQFAFTFIGRHAACDWSECDSEDAKLNAQSRIDCSRILSVYKLNDGSKIWLISDAENSDGVREALTLLLPCDY